MADPTPVEQEQAKPTEADYTQGREVCACDSCRNHERSALAFKVTCARGCRIATALAEQRERTDAARAAAVHLYACMGCGTCETLYSAAIRRGDA